MATCIVGAGLSGLALAVYLKINSPSTHVVIISDGRSGNTLMAGQRYRPAVGNKSDEVDRFLSLLIERNNGVPSSEMVGFVKMSKIELEYWTSLDPTALNIQTLPLFWEQEPTWFGPQFGRPNKAGFGRGRDVLKWFSEIAIILGVQIIRGTAVKIKRRPGFIDSLEYLQEGKLKEIKSKNYVLAGGTIGGTLFNSTNVPINKSPHELAFNAGLPLVGSTVNMFHILGNTNELGETKIGCFETDNLANSDIYLYNKSVGEFNIFDKTTSELLKEHQAHYHFSSIARRFLEYGGVVQIRTPGKEPQYGKVSHHYSHIGIATDNGVRVSGLGNLYAIGDAASTGFWNNYQIRLPGVALTNCLVTAQLAANEITKNSNGSKNVFLIKESEDSIADLFECPEAIKKIRNINSECILNIAFELKNVSDSIGEWMSALDLLTSEGVESTVLKISKKIAEIYINNTKPVEPIYIRNV